MVDDPTARFSSRVEAYIQYRPSYPPDVFATLRQECAWTEQAQVADVGSGTGISAELFLERGNRVFGVEPNQDMRSAAERLLAKYPLFVSVNGRAEATTLDASVVDFVVAAQSFHWFDHEACRREFARILRPHGFVLLLWNERQVDTTAFLRAYELLLRTHSRDYARVNHKDTVPESLVAEFFAPHGYGSRVFANRQDFDFDGLQGRARSSSYVPAVGDPSHDAFMSELKRIFDLHSRDGIVTFEYATRLFFGRLS